MASTGSLHRLPIAFSLWERLAPRQSTQDTLSPVRVAQTFPLILAAVGTPAQPPKTRGKSPGRAPGHQPPPRPTYPTVKKHASKKAKSEESLNKADSTAA
ncbi:MAG: hypothetical protein V7L23_01900 [Nostoc sp.]|uniref:hypothetical protein n=1 Tax=Nostoc sp. TaxID=1180 RepID=UPI002FF0CCB4